MANGGLRSSEGETSATVTHVEQDPSLSRTTNVLRNTPVRFHDASLPGFSECVSHDVSRSSFLQDSLRWCMGSSDMNHDRFTSRLAD